MLEIIIAILLIYALFASVVSGINEMIVQMFAMRGRILFEGIVMMLGELPKDAGAGIKSWFKRAWHKLGFGVDQHAHLTKSLYEHPLIDTLSPPGGSRPSYISAATFSTALVQVLSNDGSLVMLSQKLDDRTTPLGKLLGPMLDEADGDLEKFKTKVENHFNAVMDRVAGWYKRRAQVVIFLIGLVLSAFLNVDTIYIAQQLQRNPAQVETLVQAAERLSLKVDEVETSLPHSHSNGPMDQDSNANEQRKSIEDDFLKEVQEINHKIDEFKHLGLPIGWDLSEKSDALLLPHQDVRFFWLGWFLTALAGALGAPFWFDAISKLFAVRGTGKKPE